MKKKNKWVIIGFNIVVGIFAIIDIVSIVLYSCFGIIPYLFGIIGFFVPGVLFILGIVLEGIMLFVLAIMNKKIVIFLPNFVLVPIVYYASIWLLFTTYEDNIHEIKLNNYDETLIIVNEQFLFDVRPKIYEKQSPITCTYISGFGYDEFLNEGYYQIEEYSNGVEIKTSKSNLYLKYENNKFVKVQTKEELL